MKFNQSLLEQQLNWRAAIRDQKYVLQLSAVVVSLLAILLYLPVYFHDVIGPRQGVLLNDLILNAFTPADYSWPIFLLIYFSLAAVLQGIALQPHKLLFALTCYLGITVLRMITMYLFTLEPPTGMVLLHDPLIDNMAYGGNIFTKDLFFSGHVATLTLMALMEKRPWVKRAIILATIVVAVLLMVQRVHYSVDVFFAPLAAFLVTRLVQWKLVSA